MHRHPVARVLHIYITADSLICYTFAPLYQSIHELCTTHDGSDPQAIPMVAQRPTGCRPRSPSASVGGPPCIVALHMRDTMTIRAITVPDSHQHPIGRAHHPLRTPQVSVPASVKGDDGRPVHHGIVERCYDKLRAIIQLYVLDKQEARVCLCTPAMHAFTVAVCSSSSSRSPVAW